MGRDGKTWSRGRALGTLFLCAVVSSTFACGSEAEGGGGSAGSGSGAAGTFGVTAGTGFGAAGSGDPSAAGTGLGTAGTGGIAGTDASTAGTSAVASCVPDRDVYDTRIKPILEQRCGLCHGESPDHGAPFGLLDYDALIAGVGSARIHERMVVQLGAGTMPPPNNIRPTPSEHDALVEWASCGQSTPPYPTSLVASRPVLSAPATAPVGLDHVDLTASAFVVADGTTDLYKNFFFANVVDSEQFIRRIEVVIDKSRVVHHITLHYANQGDDRYLYAWAPGTGAVEFPDGGLRVRPSDAFRVEIHYNNLSGEGTQSDSSGVRLYVGEPTGTEYAMLDPNTFKILVLPGQTSTASVTCTAQNDFTIFAGMPHMHETGESYEHVLNRMDGTSETLIELSGWSFDLQFFYEMGVAVKTGDKMTITCNYKNDTDAIVTGGTGTKQEMCYDFIYVTPASGALDCQ